MRALTGAVFVIVLVGCILWRFESFGLLFTIITSLGLWEFYTLAQKNSAQPQRVYGTIAGTLIFLITHLSAYTWQKTISLLILPLFFLVFIIELYRKKEQPFLNIAYTILGLIYVALPFSLWNFLIYIPHGGFAGGGCMEPEVYSWHLLLGYFLLMWTSDTGAYLSGKAFGKHKLFERISPKKTWEGTIGGAIMCLAVAFTFSCFPHIWGLNLFHWIVIALIIVIAGNLGDLSESMFKRSINVKDSGTILPGHGGILDRFDAVLISTPFVFVYWALAT